eukprot:3160777-Rhodomonas_salina.1
MTPRSAGHRDPNSPGGNNNNNLHDATCAGSPPCTPVRCFREALDSLAVTASDVGSFPTNFRPSAHSVVKGSVPLSMLRRIAKGTTAWPQPACLHSYSCGTHPAILSLQKWCPQRAGTALPGSTGYPSASSSVALPQAAQLTVELEREVIAVVHCTGVVVAVSVTIKVLSNRQGLLMKLTVALAGT